LGWWARQRVGACAEVAGRMVAAAPPSWQHYADCCWSQLPACLRSFRRIIRASRGMPTVNRRDFIRARARREYDLAVDESDPEKIEFHLRYAETQLESIHVQVRRGGRVTHYHTHTITHALSSLTLPCLWVCVCFRVTPSQAQHLKTLSETHTVW
jgi:hypothetical protein